MKVDPSGSGVMVVEGREQVTRIRAVRVNGRPEEAVARFAEVAE
jgi:hypothetical protein